MGATLLAGGGGRRRRGSRHRNAGAGRMAEINVTPFVDVMLVLLIIFMVAAPLLTVGVPVELPQSAAGPLDDDKEPLTVSVRSDGTVYLQDNEVELDELVPRLTAIAENVAQDRIFVRADKSVDYGRVMTVMGLLSAAGFTKIGLVTEQAQGAPAD
jgi:biopolymer transport protein TolR